MKNRFVEGLSNVTRFLSGTRAVEARGSREAAWHLVTGEPGLGKSGTLTWYALQHRALFIRAKAGWTPHWALTDLADVLGVSHARSTERLFNTVMPALMEQCNAGNLQLIIDEIDHAARDVRVLETLRDLTDHAEIPLIAGGMSGAQRMMKRFPQIYSRIAEVTTFAPASIADVRVACSELSDVKIGEDLVVEIQRRTNGRLRGVKNAIARVEHLMKKERCAITLEMWGNRALTNDERTTTPALAAVA
ncbi:MAG TPA: ATP-binding protein [Rhizomicrobium sp.]|jgi:hypothetical protein